MTENYQSLLSEIQSRLRGEYYRENNTDTGDLYGLPYSYVISGLNNRQAFFYWDTFFINQALLHLKMVDEARHHVENLIYMFRKFGYIPTSNQKNAPLYTYPPLLPWIIRDVYRATGDKEWLRRVLPDALKEFNNWTTKPHTSPTGLYRYALAQRPAGTAAQTDTPCNSGLLCSTRFLNCQDVNPVDLNAILYRNARMLYDLQIECYGHGEETLLNKSEQIKKFLEMCWDEKTGFYYDNDFVNKKLVNVKALSGFMPLFVEMVDKSRAKKMLEHIKSFVGPGGIAFTDKDYGAELPGLAYPLTTGPCIYFIIKGMCDYEFMEDAADIGSNWLNMVLTVYRDTGELWEWYNIKDKTVKTDKNLNNTPVWGWTAGTIIALIDALGLKL
ncbi:MAG TPA: trehalase family glycosidase [bacterium]|nr:trehalase family glycosidase [bacterium]HPN44706.1 trehalase family glycosidase [bacterium]